jgi:hypothetical protein
MSRHGYLAWISHGPGFQTHDPLTSGRAPLIGGVPEGEDLSYCRSGDGGMRVLPRIPSTTNVTSST